MEHEDITYYAVGGAVRDLLLDRKYRDVDYAFTGSEKDFLQRNPSACKIETGNSLIYFLHGQEYAFLGTTEKQSLPAFEKDLLRRDFTINALLLSPGGVLHAHPLAFTDLRAKCIRPASASALKDDPVRCFRAARFTALLPDFHLHEETVARMREAASKNRLSTIAAEQVGKECLKACAALKPGNFLRSLSKTDCLAPWFSDFARGGDLPAGPARYHTDSVLEHTATVMDGSAANIRILLDNAVTDKTIFRTASTSPEKHKKMLTSLTAWMALCHDLGKTATPGELLPRHLGHEARGRDMAGILGARLHLPRLFIKAGMLAASLHMKAALYGDLRPGTKLDLLSALRPPLLALPFAALVATDSGQEQLPFRIFQDLERILSVRLPAQFRNQGKKSGERLRQMRCGILGLS